jgi:MscS family membrane protein
LAHRYVQAAALLLAALIDSRAQTPAPPKLEDPLHRESPQSCVSTFLDLAHARNYERAQRYLDLSKLPSEQRRQGPRIAQQLQTVLDRDGDFDEGALSREPEGDEQVNNNREPIASFQNEGRKVVLDLERHTLRPGLSIWLFSSDSIARIPQLMRLSSESPLERRMPEPLVQWRLVETPLWRWLALALVALFAIPLCILVSRLVLLLLEPLLRRLAPRLDTGILGILQGPLALVLITIAFRTGMAWIEPAKRLDLFLNRMLALIFIAAITWAVLRIVDRAHLRVRSYLEGKHREFSYSILPLFSRVAKITAVLLAAAAVFSEWGYNATTIVAGLGLGGVALALAAQKTIENLFGGVAVITDQPVVVGDICKAGDLIGTVEDIGLRSARIRTLDRTLVTVPNGAFSSMTLENLSRRDKSWFHLTLNLKKETTADQIRSLLHTLTEGLSKHEKVEVGPLPVRYIGVVDLEVFAYVQTIDCDEFLRIRQDLLLWIMDVVAAAGTGLA